MKKFTLGTLVASLFCSVIPASASAYFTTSQSTVFLNDNTVLFSIEYSFGMEKASLNMPIGTRQNSEFNAETELLGYEFLNNGESLKIENEAAIVLSNAEVNSKEKEYSVPKGKARSFQLIAIAQLSDSEIENISNLSLHVTSLPFDIVTDNGGRSNHLNDSELIYYKTPELSF